MCDYRFSNALGYTFEQLADMHNASFSGYVVPITMTPEQVADFWRLNHIDANRCVVMHDAHNTFVGMARMGTRGTRGWCGGFGIVPAFRGTGVSKLLADEMVRIARETGLSMLQLEVLTQNIRARRLYERVGFVVRRRLLGLQIAISALPESGSLSLERLPLETLLSWPEPALAELCWSLEPASLLAMQAEMWAWSGPDGQRNMLVVQRQDSSVRIQAALLQSQFTDTTFAALLRAVGTDAETIQVFNAPEENPLVSHAMRVGFTQWFSQYEMTLACEPIQQPPIASQRAGV